MTVVHGYEDRSIGAGEFKQRCLKLLDEVSEQGVTLVVTKRGRPVARVVPIDRLGDLRGTITVLTDNEEELFTTNAAWEADAGILLRDEEG